jgi:L-lactate dehydrogenase complex protein LldG
MSTITNQFISAATAVGANCIVVNTVEDSANAVIQLLESTSKSLGSVTPRVGLSDAPLVHTLTSALSAHSWQLYLDHQIDKTALFTLDVGITGAQWGIAETGTLVIHTQLERNRQLSLVPPIHIVLLSQESILGTCAEVLNEIERTMSHAHHRGSAVTFITGPSRTSDIELIPVVGVHGPQQLHVIIIQEPLPPLLTTTPS